MSPAQRKKYWREWAAVHRIDPSIDRHALQIAALGADKSHLSLTNAELDLVLAQFRLVIDPDDLRAALTLSDPDRQKRRRITWAIRRFPTGLVNSLMRDKFDAATLENLTTAQLQMLLMTLKRLGRQQNAVIHHGDTESTKREMVASDRGLSSTRSGTNPF
jgi:hypothetical protein